MMKYTSNTWHALKVCFANEIGNLCKQLDVDSHEVMDIFCRDEKLNLSPYYLKPGFAFGGSCLPKDVRALQYRAKEVDVELPLISPILPSNKLQIQHAHRPGARDRQEAASACSASASRRAPTTCARARSSSSPRRCSARAARCSIYDKNVSLARLVGANKEYIEQQIPHLSSLLCDTDRRGDRRVRGRSSSATRRRSSPTRVTRCRPDQIVIDLVRLPIYGAAIRGRLPRHLLVGCATLLICHETRRSIARAWSGGSARSRPSPAPSSSASRADGCASAIAREIKRVGVWRFLDVLAFRVYHRLIARRGRSAVGAPASSSGFAPTFPDRA